MLSDHEARKLTPILSITYNKSVGAKKRLHPKVVLVDVLLQRAENAQAGVYFCTLECFTKWFDKLATHLRYQARINKNDTIAYVSSTFSDD